MFKTTIEQREREVYFCEGVFVVPLPSVLSNINLEDHALPSTLHSRLDISAYSSGGTDVEYNPVLQTDTFRMFLSRFF